MINQRNESKSHGLIELSYLRQLFFNTNCYINNSLLNSVSWKHSKSQFPNGLRIQNVWYNIQDGTELLIKLLLLFLICNVHSQPPTYIFFTLFSKCDALILEKFCCLNFFRYHFVRIKILQWKYNNDAN